MAQKVNVLIQAQDGTPYNFTDQEIALVITRDNEASHLGVVGEATEDDLARMFYHALHCGNEKLQHILHLSMFAALFHEGLEPASQVVRENVFKEVAETPTDN